MDGRDIEQPREPRFYPNENEFSIGFSKKEEDMLQSIDHTLKRIEAILHHQFERSQSAALENSSVFQQKLRNNEIGGRWK